MTYEQTLQAINTFKAMEILKLSITQAGPYLYFKCPDCNGRAVVKGYGEKKGLVFCTACKKASNLIKLAEELMKTDTHGAKKFLEKSMVPQEKLTEPPKKIYELEYHTYLEERGITKDTAEKFGIGVPKGKTMLAGHVAFTVHNEHGRHIAYWGVSMKDGKNKFYHTFNPEKYLYRFSFCGPAEPVILCIDLFDCIRRWEIGQQAVCNFGLPYLSDTHLSLLSKIGGGVEFLLPEEKKKDFAVQALELKTWYKFAT